MIMADKIRVLVHMRHQEALSRAAMTAQAARVPALEGIKGFTTDPSYSPVMIPHRQRRQRTEAREVGRAFTFDTRPEVSTYLLRGEVEDEAALRRLTEEVEQDPNGIGVFSDPRISAIAVCPGSAVGLFHSGAWPSGLKQARPELLHAFRWLWCLRRGQRHFGRLSGGGRCRGGTAHRLSTQHLVTGAVA